MIHDTRRKRVCDEVAFFAVAGAAGAFTHVVFRGVLPWDGQFAVFDSFDGIWGGTIPPYWGNGPLTLIPFCLCDPLVIPFR